MPPSGRKKLHRGTRAVLGLLVVLSMMGCAVGGGPGTLSLNASYPTLGKSRSTRHAIASLVVSTPTWLDFNLASGDDGAIMRPTGYTLYDDQGRKLDYIRNYIGSLDREPTTLELEPGKYLILLERPGKLPPAFWVVVEPGKLTEVNLPK